MDSKFHEHPLTENKKGIIWACNVCQKPFQWDDPTLAYTCQKCNFDVCANCWKNK